MSDIETIAREIAHFGVKGMHWGQRKSPEAKAARADKKFERKASSLSTMIKVQNGAADRYNQHDVHRINNKPEYKNADFTKPSDLRTKYYKEHSDAFVKRMEESANATKSSSGRLSYTVHVRDDGSWNLAAKEAKHADGSGAIKVTYDSSGHIVKIEPQGNAMTQGADMVNSVLEHHGVKGMKWGRRKDRSPVDTRTAQKPGKRLKVSGGQNHPAHKDAIDAAKLKQKAKKSSTDSLSNDELKTLVARMNLEAQVSSLSQGSKGKGRKFVESEMEAVGKQQARRFLAKKLAKKAAVAAALA